MVKNKNKTTGNKIWGWSYTDFNVYPILSTYD
jgi:hypothetical protein